MRTEDIIADRLALNQFCEWLRDLRGRGGANHVASISRAFWHAVPQIECPRVSTGEPPLVNHRSGYRQPCDPARRPPCSWKRAREVRGGFQVRELQLCVLSTGVDELA
jgi:hypothetical protein